MNHIFLGLIFILLPLAGLITGIKLELYRYRNIVLSAIFFAFAPLGITLLFGPEYESFILFLYTFPTVFVRWSVIPVILLTVLMLLSNIFLVHREGMRFGNIVGTCLGFSFIIASAVIHHLSGIELSFSLSLVRMVLVCLLGYGECLLFGMILMGVVAAYHRPAYDKDFIIILGCSISKSGGLLPLLKGRTNRAIRFAWEQEIKCGKSMRYTPSGGKGEDEIMSEGSAMELYLLSHGAESYEVFPERESRNTKENFLFSKSVIDSICPNAAIAFSTTGYHVLRSGILAAHLGIKAEGIGSRTKWYFSLNGFAREIVALFVMGKKSHIICLVTLALLCLASALAELMPQLI